MVPILTIYMLEVWSVKTVNIANLQFFFGKNILNSTNPLHLIAADRVKVIIQFPTSIRYVDLLHVGVPFNRKTT